MQTLVERFLAEGEAAFEPRSRRPHTSPTAVSAAMEEQIVRLRKELAKRDLDAGADTIGSHLASHPEVADRAGTACTRAPVTWSSTGGRI